MMNKYACHRVYIRQGQYLKQAFVTINEHGNLIDYATFSEEIRDTEWIGGVIVLSDSAIASNEDFHTWASKHIKIGQSPVYAWHLSEYDFEQEEPTPNCIFRRL